MVQPSAPIGFENPTYNEPVPNAEPNFKPEPRVVLSEEDIRNLPLVNEKGKRIFSQKDVQKMKFNAIEPSICYLYELDTFTEIRYIKQAQEPCMQQNSAWSDAPPAYAENINPYEIGVEPDGSFTKHSKSIELPNSSRVQACMSCQAMGAANCRTCLGSGNTQCKACGGSGRKAIATSHNGACCRQEQVAPSGCIHCKGRGLEDCNFCHGNRNSCIHCNSRGYKNCFFCNNDGHLNCIHYNTCHGCQGRGVKSCATCQGRGRNVCKDCNGFGNIRFFQKLVVDYDVVKSHFYTSCEVPEQKLVNCTGDIIFSDDQDSVVRPVTTFKNDYVNQASQNLVQEHMRKCQNACRLLRQRHKIWAVPITKIHYTLGKKDEVFWVYGDEKLCYVVKEPGCCSII